MSKISALTALASTGIANDDVLPIVDTSATATKKIAMLGLLQACLIASAKIVPDENGNEWLKFVTTGSAVNEFTITNAATGNNPIIAATGGDTNIGIALTPKGTGGIVMTGNGSALLVAGRQGATNPGLTLDASTATCVTGLKITPAAAAGGLDLTVTSSGTDENLTVNAKGTGTISLNPTGTGNVITPRPIVITSASANAFAVGRQGTTNPGLLVDASTGSCVTGLKITPAAAAGGLALVVTSSGTDENLTLNAKGAGTVTINGTATGNIVLGRAATGVSLAVTGAITSSGATAGVGYATGAGGAVTQGTSRTTGVTLNTVTGAITLVSAAGSATPASFTVTNSTVAATDVVKVCQKSGTDLYNIHVTAVAAGSFRITFYTTGGTTTEQPVFNFVVLKGVAA